MNVERDRWTPVRRGPIYCSPGCGAKCTWTEAQAARLNAKALAARLGRGWTAHVWENMGWHYSAVRQTIAVYPSRGGYYTLLSGDPGDGAHGGEAFWTAGCTVVRDPARAVANQIKLARNVLARLTLAVNLADGKG